MTRRPARRAGALLALICAIAPSLTTSLSAQDPRAVKALDQWMSIYLSGRLDLDKDRINKSSPGVRSGIVSPGRARSIGHVEELDAICRALAEHDTAVTAERLLKVASVGLDPAGRGDVELRLQVVRRVGEEWLDRLDGLEVLQAIEAAADDERAQKGMSLARRRAALRALGRRQKELFLPSLERGLLAGQPEVRLAAAEACGSSEVARAMPPLIGTLSTEQDELVLTAGFDAMLRIVTRHREALDQDVLRRTADVAVAALGRATWRSDLAAVELLEKVRSAQSVPALIALLGRFEAGSSELEQLRSGLLKERAHEVLISLTGVRFSAGRPDQWRSWWEEVSGTFEVVEVPETESGSADDRTVTSDFFGIPVRGSRVLFVIDCSGSMAQGWRGQGTVAGGGGNRKIDVARRELLEAVDRLTADCRFNMVWFGNGAEAWQRDMVPADPKTKARFKKVVEDLRADGGTNLWQGLRDGLKLESLVYGDRYGASYDQLLVLSDGVPTLGEVRDPEEILLLIKETNRYSRLRVDTVYVSGDPEMEKKVARLVGMSGAEFMKRLAEENGGMAVKF